LAAEIKSQIIQFICQIAAFRCVIQQHQNLACPGMEIMHGPQGAGKIGPLPDEAGFLSAGVDALRAIGGHHTGQDEIGIWKKLFSVIQD